MIVAAKHTTGSDVHQSGATNTTLTKTPMVPSAAGEPSPAAGELALTLLHDAAAEMGAVCLDGSPPGYYFRKGVGEGARKFLLVFNGGGWCKGGTAEEVAEACASRSAGPLGSSTHWAQTLTPDLHGVDNPNCTINPAFCTWSVAYMYYCDGVSFSGDLEAPIIVPGAKVSTVYLRGRRVLEANINHLLQTRSLGDATAVVLSGHSAGGLATYLHADAVRALLPASLPSFRAMPDAGFFADLPDVRGVKSFGAEMRATWRVANATASLQSQCVARQTDPTDCIFPENFVKDIATPLHVIQSQYDSAQLLMTLGLPCTPTNGSCNATMMSAFLEFGAASRAVANASGLYSGAPDRAIWTDACIAHTQSYYGDYYDNTRWEVPAGSGMTLADAVDGWVTGRTIGPTASHVDTVVWPNNKPCSTYGDLVSP